MMNVRITTAGTTERLNACFFLQFIFFLPFNHYFFDSSHSSPSIWSAARSGVASSEFLGGFGNQK